MQDMVIGRIKHSNTKIDKLGRKEYPRWNIKWTWEAEGSICFSFQIWFQIHSSEE